jgi:hypothetical protein
MISMGMPIKTALTGWDGGPADGVGCQSFLSGEDSEGGVGLPIAMLPRLRAGAGGILISASPASVRTTRSTALNGATDLF